jgi:hypothetical protein
MELKFLGLPVHSTMSWNSHIDIISKLNKDCYTARTVTPFLSLNSLKIVYTANFQSLITYGLIIGEVPPTF